MALIDLPVEMHDALSAPETAENRALRATLHLSDRWKILGKIVRTVHPVFDDDHPEIPLPEMTTENPHSGKKGRKTRYSGETTIYIAAKRRDKNLCPHCEQPCSVMSYEIRRYRHLDDLGHKCHLEVHLPKFMCFSCGGTPQLRFPASNPKCQHTREFDRLIVNRLRTESKSAIARDLEISTDVIDSALNRVIAKALINQDLSHVTGVYLDETQYGSGQDYVSVFTDQRHRVIFVCRGHGKDVLKLFLDHLVIQGGDPEAIRVFSADMSSAYESGILECFPNATLVWDRFHLVKSINEAMNEVRKRSVRRGVDDPLRLIKYTVLYRARNMPRVHVDRMREIRVACPDLALSYDMKEAFCEIVATPDPRSMERSLRIWIEWVIDSGPKEFKKKAERFLEKMDRIIAWTRHQVSNSVSEGINKNIQDIRRQACGYTNDRNFFDMILLRQGDLFFTF